MLSIGVSEPEPKWRNPGELTTDQKEVVDIYMKSHPMFSTAQVASHLSLTKSYVDAYVKEKLNAATGQS